MYEETLFALEHNLVYPNSLSNTISAVGPSSATGDVVADCLKIGESCDRT